MSDVYDFFKKNGAEMRAQMLDESRHPDLKKTLFETLRKDSLLSPFVTFEIEDAPVNIEIFEKTHRSWVGTTLGIPSDTSWRFFWFMCCMMQIHIQKTLVEACIKPTNTEDGEPLVFRGYKQGFTGPREFLHGPLHAIMFIHHDDTDPCIPVEVSQKSPTLFENGTRVIPLKPWVSGLDSVLAISVTGKPVMSMAIRIINENDGWSGMYFSAKLSGKYTVSHYVR